MVYFIYTRDKACCKGWFPYNCYECCNCYNSSKCSKMAEYTAHLILPLLLQSPFLHLSSHHIQALSGLLDQQTRKNKNQSQLCQPIQEQGTKSTSALDPSVSIKLHVCDSSIEK